MEIKLYGGLCHVTIKPGNKVKYDKLWQVFILDYHLKPSESYGHGLGFKHIFDLVSFFYLWILLSNVN